MKPQLYTLLLLCITTASHAQLRKMAAIGSSTAAGLATSTPDSSWVRRFSYYYKNQLGVLDTAYNLGVSMSNLYHGMPSGYTPPGGRPLPDADHNVSKAVTLLSDVPIPANGVVIVNFPSGGYDTYTIAEIMTALQIMYDSATRLGNKCYVTTTQPRTDGNFANSAVKRKLADIKDSIINRFGIARTINFWDGMYNPTDTTILAAYSAGDNVHFNNAGHRILFERVRAKNVFDLPAVQYRSNVSPTGLWESASSWQVFNGTSWVAATMPPASGSGTITILNGDSIRINSYTDLDQVVIEGGGILTMFNNATPVVKLTVALNDGAGDDIIVNSNGRLYISGNATLNGTGTVRNSSGGLFTIRNRGVLETNAINNGTTWVNNTGIIRNRSFTNNKNFVLADFTLNLIQSAFINNDSFNITGNGITYIADSTLVGGTFTNSATGTLYRQATAGTTNINPSITFTNNGKITGFGEYTIYNTTVSSTGSIAPGSSPGRLTVNPAYFTGRNPVVNIEISSTGAVQGTHYDHLIISNIAPTTKNISGTTLNVTDNASDPIGTVYTIITPAAGTITGTFAAVHLSPTLTGPLYNSGNFITVVKSSVVPLQWGHFKAVPKENKVGLEWSTLQESNTAHFVIQHSTGGEQFSDIGMVSAQGNSTTTSNYKFMHSRPDLATVNFYRLKQVDKDGDSTYSVIRRVYFRNGRATAVQVMPNPVQDILQVIVQDSDITVMLSDLNGKWVRRVRLAEGMHRMDLQGLPAGKYQLAIYKKQEHIETQEIIKLP